MLLHQVASARGDFTGEPLGAVRGRIRQLADWSRLIPSATSEQALLESLLLHSLTPSPASLSTFGVVDVVPLANRLEVHVVGSEVVARFLELLPHRNREKQDLGIEGLLARSEGEALHVAFDHAEEKGLLRIWSRGLDLAPLLTEHRIGVESAGHRPLWTQSTQRPKSKGGQQNALRRPMRRKPEPITPLTHHRTSRFLASALLRRPGIWSRLAGHQGITATAVQAEHGLDWHLERIVAPERPVHDDRIPQVLGDALAGPDLIANDAAHICLPNECVLCFVPRRDDAGWDGILTVRTTHATTVDVPRLPVRQARPFVTLNETMAFNEVIPARPAGQQASRFTQLTDTMEIHGRVLQLEAPPLAFGPTAPWQSAQHLGAVWAQQGQRVLIVRDEFTAPSRNFQYPIPTWPTRTRPEAPTHKAPWHRLRLVLGGGDLQVHKGYHSVDELEELVSRARRLFHWIILAGAVNQRMCPPFLEGIADDYVLIVDDCGYPKTVPMTHTQNGTSATRLIPLTPSEAAVAWRERTLRAVPLGHIPVTGLALVSQCSVYDSDDFTEQADKAIERLGTPVLARIASEFVEQNRTVLDQGSVTTTQHFTLQAMGLAARLSTDTPAHV